MFAQIMYPAPLRPPELYKKNGLEDAALDIFASNRNPAYRKYHTVNFISSGAPLMLLKLGKEDLKTTEHANDLVKRILEKSRMGTSIHTQSCILLLGGSHKGSAPQIDIFRV